MSSQVVYVGNGHINANHNVKEDVFILNEEKVVSLINIIEPRLGITYNSPFYNLYLPTEITRFSGILIL